MSPSSEISEKSDHSEGEGEVESSEDEDEDEKGRFIDWFGGVFIRCVLNISFFLYNKKYEFNYINIQCCIIS